MNFKKQIRGESFLSLAALILALFSSACGGGSSQPGTPPGTPPPPPLPLAQPIVQGSWELVFHSEISPTVYKVFEVNLSQTGTHAFAGTTSSLVFQAPYAYPIRVSTLGGVCDGGTLSNVTVDATLSNQMATSATISFTFTETGALGSAVTMASATTDGMSITGGTYSIAAACGFPADQGTFTGDRETVEFGGDVYSGPVNGGIIVASFTSTANTFDLTVAGTDNGAQFVLTGSTVGFSLDLTGKVEGTAVHWFALYDPTYNSFVIYDANGQPVGGLHAGAMP
jgi:hypothetical protein